MEGYYQTNQLPPQQLDGQLPHPPDEQHPTHLPPNVLAMSMQDPTLPPELQQQLHQSRSGMSNNPMISGQAVLQDGHMDDVMRDGHHDIQRRRSMPQAYGNALGPAPQGNPPRRMSTIGPRDKMGFDAGPAGFGNYQFDPDMQTP